MCKFGANQTTFTARGWDSRDAIFAMAQMGCVPGFWRFPGKYLGTRQNYRTWNLPANPRGFITVLGTYRRTPITAEKGGVARAMGEGEKEKECNTEGKSRRRRDEKAPWALNYGSGEGGGVEKGRRGGGEKHAMHG